MQAVLRLADAHLASPEPCDPPLSPPAHARRCGLRFGRPAPNVRQQTYSSAASSLQRLRTVSSAFERFPARPLQG
eukprot:10182839-Alexandrium_andersonii.AAC.1